MTATKNFITFMINIVIGFFSNESFAGTILLAPFLFFAIRQVLNVFRLMIKSVE